MVHRLPITAQPIIKVTAAAKMAAVPLLVQHYKLVFLMISWIDSGQCRCLPRVPRDTFLGNGYRHVCYTAWIFSSPLHKWFGSMLLGTKLFKNFTHFICYHHITPLTLWGCNSTGSLVTNLITVKNSIQCASIKWDDIAVMVKHTVKMEGLWKETTAVYSPRGTEEIKNVLKIQVF